MQFFFHKVFQLSLKNPVDIKKHSVETLLLRSGPTVLSPNSRNRGAHGAGVATEAASVAVLCGLVIIMR